MNRRNTSNEKLWEFTYVVGNTYKTKKVRAKDAEQAFKKARLNKSVVDLQIIDENK